MSEPTSNGYWSDDADKRLRELAPVPCRRCCFLVAKSSVILDEPQLECIRADESAGNGRILNGVLMRLARETGACDESLGFSDSKKNTTGV